jgi:ribonuclease P protein component
VLPGHRRIRRSEEFRSVLGAGTRASTRTLIVHLGPLPPAAVDRGSESSVLPAQPAGSPARAGFVVGRAVGGSVTRNRVTRRLRHLVVPLLEDLPNGVGVVVRALPAAVDASSEDLARDLTSGVRRCMRTWVGHAVVTGPKVSQ